jgi:DNA primase
MKHKEGSLDHILKATDIVELIGEETTLKKRGKNYMGLCPFHDENTPSFSVSEEKQVYHCFSCKRSGNALTFIEEIKNLSKSEAIRSLAERAGIAYTPGKKNPNQKYLDINHAALEFYKVNLNHTLSGQKAYTYLLKRGFKEATLDTFDIGLAPDKKDSLYRALKDKGTLESDMSDLGLIASTDARYDVFKNRIMFPLQNEAGEVVGFSGRIYQDGLKTAKYINSTTTPVFEKNRVLYNIHRSEKAIKDADRVVLFEGFMDVMSAYQAGIEEGVAVMGTALSVTHIQMLKKHTSRVILAFDGDQAGQDAAKRFISDLKQSGFNVFVAEFTGGKDPDDYILEAGGDAFKKLLDQAPSAEEFLYQMHFKNTNTSRITELEALKKKIFKVIAPLSSMQQDYFLNRLSKDLNVEKATLEEDFKQKKRTQAPKYRKIETVEITDKFKRAERAFIHYFLKDEYYSRKFRHEFDAVSYIDKAARDIQLELFQYYDCNRHTCIVPKLFIEKLNTAQQQYFDKYIDYAYYPYHEDEYEDLIGVMREYIKRNHIKSLKKQLEEASSIDEKIRLRKKIDAINKEVNYAKRKNHSRTR